MTSPRRCTEAVVPPSTTRAPRRRPVRSSGREPSSTSRSLRSTARSAGSRSQPRRRAWSASASTTSTSTTIWPNGSRRASSRRRSGSTPSAVSSTSTSTGVGVASGSRSTSRSAPATSVDGPSKRPAGFRRGRPPPTATSRPRRATRARPGRRLGDGHEPDPDRRAVPPRRPVDRWPRQLRRRCRDQGDAPPPRGLPSLTSPTPFPLGRLSSLSDENRTDAGWPCVTRGASRP